MKVIGFTGNYGLEDNIPQSYLVTDSAILFSGRPFFVPDFAQRYVATPTIVVKTSRLGKCVAPKFAHRYWDAFTAGWSVQAVESDDVVLTALDRSFDGAAIVGDWVQTSELDDPLHEPVEVLVGDNVVARCCLSDMRMPLDDMLSRVSNRCSIKMGDLLFTGEAGHGVALQPGHHLTARIAGRQVLDVKVRL